MKAMGHGGDALHVLGIDAGGTKTVCLLADGAGTVVSSARGPGANLQAQGELEVEKVLHEVMESALAGRRIAPAAICLGIAGADRPDDATIMRGIMRRIGYKSPTVIVNDALRAPATARASWSSAGRDRSVTAGTNRVTQLAAADGATSWETRAVATGSGDARWPPWCGTQTAGVPPRHCQPVSCSIFACAACRIWSRKCTCATRGDTASPRS
jgi:hypothetical protein